MPLVGDERRAACVLASLPLMTPARLRVLLRERQPSTVVRWLRTGDWRVESPPIVRALLESSRDGSSGTTLHRVWQSSLNTVDVTSPVDPESAEFGTPGDPAVAIHQLGSEGYPQELASDPSAPALIFTRGSLSTVQSRRVGIIGSRHATAYGRTFATMLGRAMASNGVSVISGLARGIDAAAHRGALGAQSESALASRGLETCGRPVGVVASGLDVIYPPEHGTLWEDVATRGLLLSESPPGTVPAPFRFPLRNRIIAALSEVLVVVESKIDGGSMITVRHALRRGITVMAVPGATSTRASEGTNVLLRDGALVALSPEDVFTALDLDTRRQVPYADIRPRPVGVDAEILDLFDAEPLTLDDVVARRGDWSMSSLGQVALSLGRLETLGWVMCTAGWFERIDVAVESSS